MWANAQRDGRPAEYRWRALFNADNPICDGIHSVTVRLGEEKIKKNKRQGKNVMVCPIP